MQGRFYPDVFSQRGIGVVVPNTEEQEYIHDKYISELVAGVFLPETREKMLAIANRLQEREEIDGLLLGGTELPLLLNDIGGSAIPFLDTTKIRGSRSKPDVIVDGGPGVGLHASGFRRLFQGGMMNTDQFEFARQFLFLSSVLAGFAVAVAAELISMERKEKVATCATGAYLVSAGFCLVATFGYVFVLTAASGAPGMQPPATSALISVAIPLGFACIAGMVAFLVGIGLTGWIHSRALGILTTLTTVLSLAGILAIALSLVAISGY
jgi:hypothetical protein